jgi:hypothetical protein
MNKPESSADLILHRGLFTTLARSQPTATVYSYPPPSPEPVRSDPHGVLARARRRIDGADRTGPGSRPDAVDHEIEAWFPRPTASELALRSGADVSVRAAGIPVPT